MNGPKRFVAMFLVRFALLLAAFLMPLPWVADMYTTAFATTANGFLSVVDQRFPVTLRLEAPSSIEPFGPWKSVLRVTDRETQTSIEGGRLDVRSFSYRPVATFFALALASSLSGRRRTLFVLSVGFLIMEIVTMAFAALPILSRVGRTGALGVVPGRVVETMYQALATPIMVYAIPLFVWWFLMSVSRHMRESS